MLEHFKERKTVGQHVIYFKNQDVDNWLALNSKGKKYVWVVEEVPPSSDDVVLRHVGTTNTFKTKYTNTISVSEMYNECFINEGT